jgi:hypothetical protein
MPAARGFTKPVLAELTSGKILGVRAGSAPHKFTGVWMVVVNGRLFVRSWNDKPNGWCQAFRVEPAGKIQLLSGREVRVRARKTRGEGLIAAIDQAYAEKYDTRASLKWVRGFKTAKRQGTTTELVPY